MKKVTAKGWVNLRFPYFSINKNVYGKESETRYSPNGRGVVNEGYIT